MIRACRPEDAAIIRLLLLTGYRVDDIARSRLADWTGEAVTIRERKTGKVRSVRITDEVRSTVREIAGYTAPRAGGGWLLPARRARRDGLRGHLSRCTIWRIMRRALTSARLDGYGYTIHSLRRCYAADLFRRTGSLEAVRADLGHDRTSTTVLYLADYFERMARG